MEFEQRQSGLIIPAKPPVPEKPKRKFGHLEIRDEQIRNDSRELLSCLYKTMKLHRGGGGIVLPEDNSKELTKAQRELFRYFSDCLLGPDAPEMWEYT